MTSAKDYAFLSDKVYGDPKKNNEPYEKGKSLDDSSWIVVGNYINDSNSDFQGAIYKNKITGEYVYAIRGTQEGRDFVTDGKMAFGGGVDQFEYADKMLQNFMRDNPDAQISLTGHSLGGGVAQLLGAKYGLPTETFNAYGTGRYMDEYGIPPGDYKNITTIHCMTRLAVALIVK